MKNIGKEYSKQEESETECVRVQGILCKWFCAGRSLWQYLEVKERGCDSIITGGNGWEWVGVSGIRWEKKWTRGKRKEWMMLSESGEE